MSDIIEVSFYNLKKDKEVVPGDTFLVNKTPEGNFVATLADGMGSGVKANVLSQLTASMAQKFMIANSDIKHMAQTIMETLPVCSYREVSYSTITSMDITESGFVKLMEYDNPETLWFRNGSFLPREREKCFIKTSHSRNKVYYSELQMELGDRLISFSDGVTQAGIGSKDYPFGLKMDSVKAFISNLITEDTAISGQELAKLVVEKAASVDMDMPKDDITCSVVYYRKSRNTLLITGPPYERDKCEYMVDRFKGFSGRKIIAGGTTSQIIADGLGEELSVDMNDLGSDIPPRALMAGADLVTEGMLTINELINILKSEDVKNIKDINAAYRMAQIFLDSDKIYMLIGTAVNEAHQNPNMPVEMGLRRISVNNLAKILRTKYLKEVEIEYV